MYNYTEYTVIDTPQGNNAFSYEERRQLLGKAEIFVPTLQTITSSDEIELGDQIVFEEIDHHDKLRSCTGLKHLYQLLKPKKYIYIMDNHNHALRVRLSHYEQLSQGKQRTLIHIDQHADLRSPTLQVNLAQISDHSYLRQYTHLTCNIGNFIQPLLSLIPQIKFVRIKSEQHLLDHKLPSSPYLLDVDLDFRAPEMSPRDSDQTLQITRQLIQGASLCTIATSPFFLDQHHAVDLMSHLW